MLSLFLLVVTVLLIYSVFWGPLADLGEQYPSRTVMVSASGSAIAKPDVALVSFSVVSEGVNTQVVTDDNNRKANTVISYLKEQGIEKKDIKTTEYNLQPVYTQPASPGLQRGESTVYSQSFVPSIARYALTQTVQVKVRDFSKISSIMGQVVTLGVNRLQNVSFTIDDPEQFLAEARAEAFQKAAQKAKVIANDAGIKLGKIVSVNEYGDTPYGGMYDKVSSVAGRGGAEMVSAPPSIEPGSSELEVTVNIVYEIR